MLKEVKRDTMVRKSALRPSVLELATDLALAYREEPVDATLKPPKL